jgi:imidazolonepropionase-like amidohydrolase
MLAMALRFAILSIVLVLACAGAEADVPETVALLHVRVIDGTGAPAREDETVVIEDGRIAAIGPSATTPVPGGALIRDLAGRSVVPGFVGMHEHLYYTARVDTAGFPTLLSMAEPFASLYLAAGVTTIRTAGAIDAQADLELARAVDAGEIPGPRVHVTGPYLEGPGGLPEMPPLEDADAVRAAVDRWALSGATSFKAYTHLGREELAAAVASAHQHGATITGHLCAVGFREAVELGIDNIEHGFATNTDFIPDKAEDECPAAAFSGLANVEPGDSATSATIALLVERGVAITSTLAVFEQYVPGRPAVAQRVLDVLTEPSRESCLAQRQAVEAGAFGDFGPLFREEMALEKAFVEAGGTLLVGSDPTGNGCIVAGYGTQRAIELLVETGFSAVEAIRIATRNGAEFLGVGDRLGTVEVGKLADLVVVHGDPSTRIEDIRNVEIVFKEGRALDPAGLVASAGGRVGIP